MIYSEVAKLTHDHRCAWNKGDDYCDCGAIERNLETERDRYRALLAEWTEDPTECGCDTATCTGLCLPARSRAAIGK